MYRRIISLILLLVLPNILLGANDTNLYTLTLEELLSIRVESAASLTRFHLSREPASITRISREMIRDSGARNLDELLEMYVPNFQRLRQAGGPHFGIRGIISDVDNKTLLLVNGRIMNNRSISGAISERYLPLMGDIASIEVVRGPGSAMYGPGAINGVISIKTLTAREFEGREVSFAQGIIEEYSLVELRWGHRISEDIGIFFYFGTDDYSGSSPDDSPLVYSKNGTFYSAGEKITDPNLANDNQATLGKPHHKAHIHLNWKDFNFWVHKTRGGVQFVNARHLFENNNSFELSDRFVLYDHLTLTANQRITLSERISLELTGSYDIFDVVLNQEQTTKTVYTFDTASRENELNLKTMLDWDITAKHSLAFGVEFSYEQFGEDADWLTDDPAHLGSLTSDWSTSTYSLISEYQWNPNKAWTFFLGGRADKYTADDWIYSPRFSSVFSPNKDHQIKLLCNRGVRRGDEVFIKLQSDGNNKPDVEEIDMLELRHDWQLTKNLAHSLSLFHYKHDLLGFVQQELAIKNIGELSSYGAELELYLTLARHKMSVSHSYTKMSDFSYDGSGTQVVTAEYYGYGDDLANWANHLSKINYLCKVNDKWQINSSLVVYWGYPGAEDYTTFNNEAQIEGHVNNRYSQSDGRTDAFSPSFFLRSGVHYQAKENMRISLNLHNILGWLDEDLNKRNYYARMAGYRIEAPAASVRLDMQF